MNATALKMFGMSLVACFMGCATAGTPANSDYPDWFMNPTSNCAVSAVKGATTSIAQKTGEANARGELSRQVQAKVMGMIETSFRNVTGTGFEDAQGQEFSKGAERTLYKNVQSGGRITNKHFSSGTGEWVFEVCIDAEALKSLANKMAQEAAKKLLDGQEAKHKEIVGDMDKQLDKEFPVN